MKEKLSASLLTFLTRFTFSGIGVAAIEKNTIVIMAMIVSFFISTRFINLKLEIKPFMYNGYFTLKFIREAKRWALENILVLLHNKMKKPSFWEGFIKPFHLPIKVDNLNFFAYSIISQA